MINPLLQANRYLALRTNKLQFACSWCFYLFDGCSGNALPSYRSWSGSKSGVCIRDDLVLWLMRRKHFQQGRIVYVIIGLRRQFECTVGTRQGCVSSPIIFSLFINDLVKYIRQTFETGIFVSQDIEELYAFMFADDVSRFADTVRNFQQ